jgi:hypothetical protein
VIVTSDEPAAGDVIRYPYLWRWQSTRGESEGRKDRPTCLVLAVRDKVRKTHLVLLAITSQQPADDRRALEIPELERRRAGLDDTKQAWIMVDEYNYDIAEQSFYFDSRQKPLGAFSRRFLGEIASAFKPTLQGNANRVDRTAE